MSVRTIEFHRKNTRTKIGIKKQQGKPQILPIVYVVLLVFQTCLPPKFFVQAFQESCDMGQTGGV